MKMLHVQSREVLKRMCKVIENITEESKIDNAAIHDALIEAVHSGNPEFITTIVRANPSLVWNPNIARTVFEVSIKLRQRKVFNLIYGIPDSVAIVNYRDENGNNMIHKAAVVADSRLLNLIPGEALQMQIEIQWFKAVEAIASPSSCKWINKQGMTPQSLFTKSHEDLVVTGEKWTKSIASSSTVVGALIVTVTFAAAFTFPGGNDQNTGFPMFLGKKLFNVFMMSNAVALFTSTTSVLVFLRILTSRYGEKDFLTQLPSKLIFGLCALFLSICSMIIAFCAGISLMFHEQIWIVVPLIFLACIPVLFFGLTQFPLLVDILTAVFNEDTPFGRAVGVWI